MTEPSKRSVPDAHDLQATVPDQRPSQPSPEHPSKRMDGEDLQATVPAKGWDQASTLPASAPAAGSGPSTDQTLPMQLNVRDPAETQPANLSGNATVDPDATMVDTKMAAAAAAARLNDTAPTAPSSTSEAQTIAQTPPPATGSQSTAGRPSTGSFSQSQTSGGNLSGSFTRGQTRLGRTRINNRLQLTDQQLDERLQLSRTSVLTDMTAARGAQAVPAG